MELEGTTTAAASDGVVVVEGVGHRYRSGTVALAGVDLRIGTGLFGLLGPNGAGKSTLMRILCTLLTPSAGRATVGGHDVVSERLAVRQLIGYLPQDFGGWRLHRVDEVLDTLARLSGVDGTARRRQRVAEVLAAVGLEEVAGRKVKKLSGGMVRRLGVAQALVHEPRVLVVDEPTVGLDPEERLRFRQLMAELGRDRVIVLSTHIVADLGSGCADLAIIDRGQVVFRGSPATLVASAHGRVLELTVAATDEIAATAELEVVARRSEGASVTVRAVHGDDHLPDGARAVADVTLEEAYLAFMAATGHHAHALVEEAS